MAKCPHCSAPISPNALFAHGMLLGGSHMPLRCSTCQGRSYLGRTGSNARWALAILALAFVAWLPSPISQIYSSVLPRELAVIARAGVWAVGILVAFFVFTFGGRLIPLESHESATKRFIAWSYVADYAFLGLMVLWMYFVYRSVKDMS